MRLFRSGRENLFVVVLLTGVRIKQANFRESVWAFGRDQGNCPYLITTQFLLGNHLRTYITKCHAIRRFSLNIILYVSLHLLIYILKTSVID